MAVKKRYKQTEAGVIPEDWKVRPIREISNPVRGGSPRPAGDPRFFDGNFIPWLTVAALTNIPSSQLKVSHTDSCLTEEGSLRSRILYPGTLILANSGATLGVAKILGIKCCANDGIAALLNFNATVSTTYLVHYINTRTQYLRDVVATGNGQPNLNTDLIGNFKIPLPPTLAEQEAIAGALSDADAWIESLEQLIAKKRQIKQGAMQELLTGKRRLPGFSGVWEVSTVGREFEIKLGKMLDAEKNFGVSKPFIGNRAVQWERIDINDLATVPMSRSDIDRFRLRKGDLLVCEGGEVGRAAIWDAPISECYYQKALHRLRPVRGFSSRLMVGLLRLWSDRGVFSNFVTQTSIAHLPREKFMEMPLLVPTPPEQIAIAEVLAQIDAGIRALESKLAKAREIKQGMMQELLTGRIRLIEN